MGFFKKIFGKKKKDESLSEMLDVAGLDLEVGFGDEPENLNEEDYKYNHCFIFYGLNEEGFSAIENQVQNFDGPHHLSLLRSMEGVLMADVCSQGAGSEKVKEAMQSYEDSQTYVEQRVDTYLEQIKENFDSQIGEDCLELINIEKPYFVENIRYAMEEWAASEFFEKEDFIGAMIVFVKSSKEFDKDDSISENQDGMNLPLVTRSGFIRDCIYATEDLINVQFKNDDIDWMEDEGNNPRNNCNYRFPFGSTPFGFNYFDQLGQLWNIEEVGKAVTLSTEWEEDEMEYHVSH
tara:strand:- start:2310 stop:3185 length:876 start_codon:yes stop_codon:yes gene_type:complete